jgi:predicted nucleic acid-binding protein
VSGFLLDTNVLSELERARPSVNVLAFIRRTALDRMFLSDVVVAEIRFGIETANSTLRRDTLTKWLKNVIGPMFAGRILPVTEDILVRWRWIVELSRPKGRPFDQSDALLAATAIQHELVVVTRDIRPFRVVEVAALDPWRNHNDGP